MGKGSTFLFLLPDRNLEGKKESVEPRDAAAGSSVTG